jgi:adenine-specific DNA-methyltransferase
MYNDEKLGQVFTPDDIVAQMFMLKKKNGRTLEPSAGDGAFANHLTGEYVAIELDKNHASKIKNQERVLNIDFFDYPITEKFDTIIGNPPYVRYQDILPQTKRKLNFEEKILRYLLLLVK